MKFKSLKYIIWAGFLVLLTSCYSEYIHLNYSLHHGAYSNKENTKVAFILSKNAYRPAKGIAKFPDGGIPKYLLEETCLYIMDRNGNKITKLLDFTDLTELIGSYRSSWKSKIAYSDSLVFCSVSPVMDWKWYIKQAKDEKDTIKVQELEKKYSQPFVIDEKTLSVTQTDSSDLTSKYDKSRQVDFTNFNKQLTKVPLSEFGLVLRELHPKSDKKYIEEVIYGENPSSLTRRAVIEQIISKLNKEQIRAILKNMKENENYSKATYEQIQALL